MIFNELKILDLTKSALIPCHSGQAAHRTIFARFALPANWRVSVAVVLYYPETLGSGGIGRVPEGFQEGPAGRRLRGQTTANLRQANWMTGMG
jgi:hypothetical protein